MQPFRGTLAACVAVGFLAACGYDEGNDLRPVVERATPPGARPVTACAGSSGLIDYASYGCTYLVQGGGGAVTEAVARALRTEGFDVSCARAGELAALRDDVRVVAEVTVDGSISTLGGVVNVLGGGYRPEGSQPIPRGSVALRLGASRQSEASASFWRTHVGERRRCDRTPPRPHPAEMCARWWNGPVGRATSEAAIRHGAEPEVQIARSERPDVSTCTYTLRTPRGFERVTARFDHGRWFWPPLRAIRAPRAFRANARLAGNGWLRHDG